MSNLSRNIPSFLYIKIIFEVIIIITSEHLLPFIRCPSIKIWLSMCLCFCGCQGGLRCSLFLPWWSCALYVMIHTVNRVLLLAWWENRDQSPRASYNQLMSFFHLWRCSHTSWDSHSILEFRGSGFCSAFCRRGKWDSGRSKDLFVVVASVCYLLSLQICYSRDREVRASPTERYCCAS